MTANFPEVVQRFTARYRLGLLRKAGLLAVLGAGILALLGWRLAQLRLGPWWSVGLPAGLGLAAAAGLAWWLSRHWMSRRGGVRYLDRALDLQQRLITAEEFASATPPPALYPLLVEDASRRCTVVGARFPRPVDRATGALAIILLFLFLWPVRGRVPLQQLAQLPQAPLPPQPPDTTPPPAPDRQDQRMDQNQQGGSSTQQASQPQSGEGREPSPASEGGQSSDSQSRGSRGEQSQQSDEPSPQGDEGQERSDRSGAGDARQSGKDADRRPDAERQRAGQDGAQAGAGAQQGSGGDAPSATASLQPQGAAGVGQSLGNQAALKAEIQELLKEVSGELKQLQAQLAVAHPETAPDAGTSTDPELYEAPMPIGPDAGAPLPMSLGTDTAETKTPRPGGGVGEPTDAVSSDAPSTPLEEAELSEAPLGERAVGRQVVPPEYRGVFERLHRDRTTTEGGP